MANNLPRNYRSPRYSDFRQMTRRHAPSELIPVVAAATASQTYENDFSAWAKGVPPWVYAAMARDCLLYSDEFRHKKVDNRAIVLMRNTFMNVYEPEENGISDIFPMISGYVYEQSFYQKNEQYEMARSYLLYLQTEVASTYQTPSKKDWEDYLGIPLQVAMTAAFILCATAAANQGRFDPTVFGTDDYQLVERLLPGEQLSHVLDLLTTTEPEAKVRAGSVRQLPNSLQRYAFNPLVERPFVDIGDGMRYAPQPKFILRAFSTENLYYRGMAKWGTTFGQSFGARVEAYTGMQLQHTGVHQVFPEFEWQKPKTGTMRSSDWFLITPSATILIECKSARMSLEAKAGTGVADELLDRYVGHAYRQLAKNAAEITASNPAFAHIPSDRPLIGMVVTAEPMFGANHAELRERFGTSELPVVTASLEDIELLASLNPQTVGDLLIDITNDPELATWSLSAAFAQILGRDSVPMNQLIDQTFDLLTPFER